MFTVYTYLSCKIIFLIYDTVVADLEFELFPSTLISGRKTENMNGHFFAGDCRYYGYR